MQPSEEPAKILLLAPCTQQAIGGYTTLTDDFAVLVDL
jgi:hypothetical protein